MEDRLKELRRVSAAGTLSQPAPFEAASSKPEPAAAGGLFRKRKASAAAVAAPQAAAAQGDIEMGAVGGKQQFMEGFFQDVEGVKADIHAIKEAIRRMSDLQAEALVAQNAKEAELSKLLQDVIHETNPRAQRAKATLQRMKEETGRVKEKNGSEFRIRDNLANTLTRKFVATMKDYQNAQTKYKAFVQKKVVRQVHIVKPEATAEEIDAVMRSGGADQFLTQAILKGADQAVRNVYRDVADKYQDVLTLEASIAELHQMFLDFSLLVEQQGELLDQIEYNVAKSGDYVSDANEHVVTAIEHAKKARKYTCCMLLFVMAIVVAAVLVLFKFKLIKI